MATAGGTLAMKRDLILLTLLGLLAYLPGLASLPVIDRDEARYAQSVVQMVETGDYIDIRLQDEPRYKKPVGAYWAQVAAVFATGQADDIRAGERPIWAQRLPSVLGALVAVWATYLAGEALFGRREAFVGAALLAVSVSLVFEAHQAKTDALLIGACAVALYGLVKGRAWPFWLAIGVGVLVKGPVILGVVGLAVLSFATLQRLRPSSPAKGVSAVPTERGTRPSTLPAGGGGHMASLLRPLPILVTLALVLPWFVAIGVVSDGAFYTEALGRDFGNKLGSAQESHGGPPSYYLLTTFLMWWPGILALPVAAVWTWRERRISEVALLLCWLVPMWLVLELVPTKLPHYTLPLYPALALLCGAAVAREWERSAWTRLPGIALVVGFGIALVEFGTWLEPTTYEVGTAIGWGLFMIIVVSAGLATWKRPVLGAAVASVAVSVWVFGINAPVARKLTLSEGAGQGFNVGVAPDLLDHRRLVTQIYREPSLVYLYGTDTRLDLCEVVPGDVVMLQGGPITSGTTRTQRYAMSGAHTCMSEAGGAYGSNLAKGRDEVRLRLYLTDACEPETLSKWAREQADPTLDCGG